MAERGLCTGKINYGIHHTIAVVIKVRQNMRYLHDFTGGTWYLHLTGGTWYLHQIMVADGVKLAILAIQVVQYSSGSIMSKLQRTICRRRPCGRPSWPECSLLTET